MKLRFTRTHGLGNDFVVLNAIDRPLTLTKQQLRHLAQSSREFIRGLLESPVTVQARGGTLVISWAGERSPVMMTGPATHVFEGEIELWRDCPEQREKTPTTT